MHAIMKHSTQLSPSLMMRTKVPHASQQKRTSMKQAKNAYALQDTPDMHVTRLRLSLHHDHHQDDSKSPESSTTLRYGNFHEFSQVIKKEKIAAGT